MMISGLTDQYVANRRAEANALREAAALRRAAANSERAIEPEGSEEVAIMSRPQPRAQEPEGTAEAAARPARPPRRSRPAPRRQPRETSADDLNAISLAFAGGERPRGGAADNIGRALGIEGYKKGGLVGAKKPVKRAMGGSIPKPPAPPKPKVPGRKAGRPATAVKVPPRKAPTAPKMPAFKKGGKVTMKGKRK